MPQHAVFQKKYSWASIVFSFDFNICYLLYYFLVLITNNSKDFSYLNCIFCITKIQAVLIYFLIYYLL